MPNFLSNLSVIANGTINPAVFVTIDPTRDFAVIQASGSTIPIGISQLGPKIAPNLLASLGSTAPTTQPAAVKGDQIGVFNSGDVCWVTVGSASVNPGDFLMNDGNGGAITATSNKYYGAIALQAGNSGELITCQVILGKV